MTHVTALLIVLTLTGSPVANAICLSWCDLRPMTAGTLCFDSVAEPMSMAISAGSGTCVALLAANPFLREEGRIIFHAPVSLGVVHALDTPFLRGARLAGLPSAGQGIKGPPASALVLRL